MAKYAFHTQRVIIAMGHFKGPDTTSIEINRNLKFDTYQL